MEKMITSELKTFMRRDDMFPGAPNVRTIYQTMNDNLCRQQFIADRVNSRNIADLFRNRTEYLLTTTTRQLCNYINSDITNIDKREVLGEMLFNSLLRSNSDDSSCRYNCEKLFRITSIHIYNTFFGDFIIDGKLKDINIIYQNFFLEGMTKAETLFNIYMLGEVNNDPIDSNRMIHVVGRIADVYTYTLMKLFVELICFYLGHVKPEIEITGEYFLRMMKIYNEKCATVEKLYDEYEFKL